MRLQQKSINDIVREHLDLLHQDRMGTGTYQHRSAGQWSSMRPPTTPQLYPKTKQSMMAKRSDIQIIINIANVNDNPVIDVRTDYGNAVKAAPKRRHSRHNMDDKLIKVRSKFQPKDEETENAVPNYQDVQPPRRYPTNLGGKICETVKAIMWSNYEHNDGRNDSGSQPKQTATPAVSRYQRQASFSTPNIPFDDEYSLHSGESRHLEVIQACRSDVSFEIVYVTSFQMEEEIHGVIYFENDDVRNRRYKVFDCHSFVESNVRMAVEALSQAKRDGHERVEIRTNSWCVFRLGNAMMNDGKTSLENGSMIDQIQTFGTMIRKAILNLVEVRFAMFERDMVPVIRKEMLRLEPKLLP